MATRIKLTEAITRLREVYSHARHFGIPHAELLAQVQEVRANYLANAPRWAWAEFKGYDRALMDRLYETDLVYGGFWKGETFYSTHSGRADYYASHGIEPSAWAEAAQVVLKTGHYWIIDGKAKPFFVK